MGYSTAGLMLISSLGEMTGKGPLGSLKPRMPAAPKQPLMPNQQQILQAQQLTAAQDAATRYGRAATVLTGTGPAAQGSTGELLGP